MLENIPNLELPHEDNDTVWSKAPEQERRERYTSNLSHFEFIDPQSFYPEDVICGNWSVVEDDELETLDAYYTSHHSSGRGHHAAGGRFHPELMKVFRNTDTGSLFAVPNLTDSNSAEHIMLDTLENARRIAPWSEFDSLKPAQESSYFKESGTRWGLNGTIVEVNAKVIEDIINGFSESRHTDSEKQEQLYEYIAANVHEAVHMKNDQGLDMGGSTRTVSELCPTVAEYLAYPGKNSKCEYIFLKGLEELRTGKDTEGEAGKYRNYTEGIILGVILLAEKMGLLKDDSLISAVNAVSDWKVIVSSFGPDKLREYRRWAEDELLLSERDLKVGAAISAFIGKHPLCLKSLKVIQEWDEIKANWTA